ncbi:MAG: hypothetical protein HXS47_00170 [Theionarchaea archaeon]|nr:hypothetical protein [Theionarchaea archaeon]
MVSKRPTNIHLVSYFIILAFTMGLVSMFSPVSFGTIEEIPRSPAWGDEMVVATMPPLLQLPSCTIDSQGTVHVVYRDTVNDHSDIFHIAIADGTLSSPQNLTTYPSLKQSVVSGIDSSGTLHIAFLDNRSGTWQVHILERDNGDDNNDTIEIIQITESTNYKEDVSLSMGPDDERIVTWTEFERGVPHIYLMLIDSHGVTKIHPVCISTDRASTKSSTNADENGINLIYLEKSGYDHIIYRCIDYTGEILSYMDLGECIHLDPVKLGIFKGPQLIVGDEMICIWSDIRTGSNDIYALPFSGKGTADELIQLTHNPTRVWSWMPCVVSHKGTIHMVYVNNAFGHRIFHSVLGESYQELGTITAEKERATAPYLASDGEELHCIYLQFGEENKFNIVYRNTYPSDEKEIPFSDKLEESSIRYLYSLGFSFLFAFPLTFRDNALGIMLFVCGFFVFRFFKLQDVCASIKHSEYMLVIGGIVVLSLLRGSFDYTFLAPVAYQMSFIIYGLITSTIASVLFKYLMGSRFDFEIRILLTCLVFLYLSTLFMLLPIIPYI